ncbi:MAG: SOS response-associated peptidase [Haloarculaceae archaeon]
MCGRYSLFAPPDEIERRFDATFAYEFEPRYNAAPRQELPVITDERAGAIQALEWGLVPSWAEDRTEYGFINARAETLDEKPSFRGAFERSESSGNGEPGERTGGRCLVLADGFYEWVETSGGKQPYRVTIDGGEPFAMAGLWERWRPPQRQTGLGEFGTETENGGNDEPVVETFTIVTTEPNDVVAELHHRMGVILPADERQRWLDGTPADAQELLEPIPGERMEATRVSQTVNDPSNDDPSVLQSAKGDAGQ